MGTPSAVPVMPPKLLVMSERCTPDSISTLGPLEPSPGYGPAVSPGAAATHSSAAVAAVVVEPAVVAPAVVDPGPGSVVQPTASPTAPTPATPNSPRSAARRFITARS